MKVCPKKEADSDQNNNLGQFCKILKYLRIYSSIATEPQVEFWQGLTCSLVSNHSPSETLSWSTKLNTFRAQTHKKTLTMLKLKIIRQKVGMSCLGRNMSDCRKAKGQRCSKELLTA